MRAVSVKIAAIFFLFAVGLVLSELSLRLIERVMPINLVPTAFDERFGLTNWPGYSGCYDGEGFSCYSINSRGWRDEDHEIEKPEGKFRIAVIGDSYVEALQVPLEDTFWKVAERDLNSVADSSVDVEVLAFGISGADSAMVF